VPSVQQLTHTDFREDELIVEGEEAAEGTSCNRPASWTEPEGERDLSGC